MSRFQRLIAKLSPVSVYRPLKRPVFDVSDTLVARQLKAAASRPVNGIKPVLILENPDTFVRPAHIEEGELPIG